MCIRDRACLADGYNDGLLIIDVSNPANPVLRGGYNTPGYAVDVAIAGSVAYVADGSTGTLQIIDVSNPAAPLLRSQVSGFFNAYAVAVDGGGMAYVAEGGNLRLVDVSDPANPVLRGAYNTPGWAVGVTVSNNLAYVADGRGGGVQVVSAVNPNAPEFYDGVTIAIGYALSLIHI